MRTEVTKQQTYSFVCIFYVRSFGLEPLRSLPTSGMLFTLVRTEMEVDLFTLHSGKGYLILDARAETSSVLLIIEVHANLIYSVSHKNKTPYQRFYI